GVRILAGSAHVLPGSFRLSARRQDPCFVQDITILVFPRAMSPALRLAIRTGDQSASTFAGSEVERCGRIFANHDAAMAKRGERGALRYLVGVPNDHIVNVVSRALAGEADGWADKPSSQQS